MSLSRLASQEVARSVDRGHAFAATAQPDKDDRFDLLTKYIPTETLTLFVAVMAVAPQIRDASGGEVQPVHLYLTGAVLTPLVLWLAGYGKHKATGSPEPFRPHPWPFVAALIAYCVWALSVDRVLTDEDARALAGFGALSISTLLALLEPVFGPQQHQPEVLAAE